jgi:hypothetical protein
MSVRCFGFCLLTLLLVGCKRQPSVPADVQGLYTLNPSARAYAGETIRLGDGVFAYVWFTDALSDPKLKKNPQCGRFTISGSDITLTFYDGRVSHLVITRGQDGHMLWGTDDYKKYLSTHQIPWDVLYQQKL